MSGDQEPDPEAVARAALRRSTRGGGRRARSVRRRPSKQDRDVTSLADAVDALVVDQGWQEQSAVATVMAQWPQIVGAELADHVAPASFEAGALTLQADSTAWATAVRSMLPTLHRQIEAHVGPGVVETIRILGPYAPSWTAGPRRVKGRGPRDTYG